MTFDVDSKEMKETRRKRIEEGKAKGTKEGQRSRCISDEMRQRQLSVQAGERREEATGKTSPNGNDQGGTGSFGTVAGLARLWVAAM